MKYTFCHSMTCLQFNPFYFHFTLPIQTHFLLFSQHILSLFFFTHLHFTLPFFIFLPLPVGRRASAASWFKLGLHLHVDACAALWNMEYVLHNVLHIDTMTPCAHRSSQVRNFLTSIITHGSQGAASHFCFGSIQPPKTFIKCTFSMRSQWTCFLTNSIFWKSSLLHHWINLCLTLRVIPLRSAWASG